MGKWIKCRKCGHEYNSALNRCPECSTYTLSFKNIAFIIGAAVICVVAVIGIALGFSDDKIDSLPESSGSSSVSDNSSEDKSSENQKSETPSSEKVSSEQNTESSSSRETESVSSQNSSKKTDSKVTSSVVSEIHTIVSSESSVSSDTESLPQPRAIGTVLENKHAYTTVPKYYLDYLYSLSSAVGDIGTFEDFAYTLSDEDKAYGFTEIIKNSDGSATIVMPLSTDRIKFRTEYIAAGVELLDSIKTLDFVKDAYGDNEYRDIFFELSRKDLTEKELATIVLTGLYFLENQYYEANSDNACNVYILYPDNVYAQLKFPDILVGK